jgi:hypothetical protein
VPLRNPATERQSEEKEFVGEAWGIAANGCDVEAGEVDREQRAIDTVQLEDQVLLRGDLTSGQSFGHVQQAVEPVETSALHTFPHPNVRPTAIPCGSQQS